MRTFNYKENSFMVAPDGDDMAILYQLPGIIVTEKDGALLVTHVDNKARFVQALRALRARMAGTPA